MFIENEDIYVGEVNNNGEPQGQGKMTYGNGDVYEGAWNDGKKHGQGKMIYEDGNVYDGMWKDGKPNGKGKMTYAKDLFGKIFKEYDGMWKDGKRHGEGELIYNDASVYNGAFEDGKPHGEGKMTYKESGAIYEGAWKKMEPHGQGTLTLKSGHVYEGVFEDGVLWLQGQGKLTLKSGHVYEGAFEGGLPHGEGKMTYKDGTVYEGEWKDGKLIRQGKVTFSQGVLDKIGMFYHNEEVCPICYQELHKENLSVLRPCNHIFHEKCIKQWQQQQNSCPKCSREIKHRLPISSDLLIKQIEEYKIQNPQNQNEGADQNDIIIEEENNLQQGQPELLITQLYKLMQRLDGQEENSNINMDDITNLVIALTSSDRIKINTQIKKLNEALNKESEQQMPDNQDYKKKLNLLKEAVENFKNSKQ